MLEGFRRAWCALSLLGVLAAAAPGAARAQGGTGDAFILGAGSTFVAPLISAWIETFAKDRPGVSIEYDAVGSGEGISRFITGSVDFAGTDAPLEEAEAAIAARRVLQVPVAAGMIALAYNLSGFEGELRLPRDVYPDVMAGQVRYWDDPRIRAANPGVELPHRSIVVAARRDSSGTTFALTRHLAAADPSWRDEGPGVGKMVGWRGAMLARGNEGVAQKIKISDGGIGYVEYGFARRLGLPMAILENKAGKFVAPSEAAAMAAMEDGKDSPLEDPRAFLADPSGWDAYPIVTLTWILLNDRPSTSAKDKVLREFVSWGLTDGQALGAGLGYIPLPDTISQPALATVAAGS
jgi:phosphate transport system substrate-binding protein